ncbi:MAG: hypothetical protein IJT82_04075 [Schwartzia sp.]|nr:hypothetical protein [Schwartzia sp. (in: firmicutes)]
MLIESCTSVAFYCQRCGSIHVHDVPYFSELRVTPILCDSCGHEQGVIERLDGRIDIVIPCVTCGTVNRSTYSIKKAHHIHLEKIYCGGDRFELGYIGRHHLIDELMAFNQAEFEALHPNDGKNFIEKQRVLLEALNRVHEMAEQGDITCPCGCDALAADIRGNSIVLECRSCGSDYVLRAEKAQDLTELRSRIDISLVAPSARGKRKARK